MLEGGWVRLQGASACGEVCVCVTGRGGVVGVHGIAQYHTHRSVLSSQTRHTHTKASDPALQHDVFPGGRVALDMGKEVVERARVAGFLLFHCTLQHEGKHGGSLGPIDAAVSRHVSCERVESMDW